MKADLLVQYLDEYLNIQGIDDDSLNGLQVANRKEIQKVALAVDASQSAFEKSREAGADLLFVHHGLFWGKPYTVTDSLYERLRLLIESNIALYAAHLPLDLHPEVGNNAQICRKFGWIDVEDFGEYHGSVIGKMVRFKKAIPFTHLLDDVKGLLGDSVQVWDFGPKTIQRFGVVSGGGLMMIEQAVDSGLDGLITGETEHKYYWTAKEAGIHVLFGGHYATETLGVKAVGEKLKKEFNLDTVFLDLPTGL